MALEDIIREGTTTHFNMKAESAAEWLERKKAKPSNNITCADGFTLSVIAGDGCYCTPRPGWFNGVPETYEGPYVAVEVGYPSERPQPWAEWERYCENAGSPTDTVYGHVPVGLVRALVALHGGEKS